MKMIAKKVCVNSRALVLLVGFVVFLILTVGYYLASHHLTAQRTSTDTRAIINGTRAAINEYPYFVKLRSSTNNFCGGTLISKNYIVTAAHCVYDIYTSSGSIVVMIGVDTYSGSYYGHNIWYVEHSPVNKNIFIPPEYKPTSSSSLFDYDYDIALIRILPAAWDIPTLSFPSEAGSPEKNSIDKKATIIGVGVTSIGSLNASGSLMKADLYIRSVNDKGVMILNSKDESPQKRACLGDSGGPAIVDIGFKRYVAGVAKSGYCYFNTNSKYTSTSFNSKWITSITGILPDSGTTTMYSIFPTQQPLINICYSRAMETECLRFSTICKWVSNSCTPR